jgi:hypothetical protein
VSLPLLDARLAALAPTLRRCLATALPPLPTHPHDAPFVATGIGASEGPARVFAALARRRLGARAEFVPVWAAAEAGVTPDTTRVVFSQGLSPNARMALGPSAGHRAPWLVTATPEGVAAGEAWVVAHPPAEESGLLLRVLGPAAATLTAVRLVCALAAQRGVTAPPEAAALDAVPAAVEAALAAGHALAQSIVWTADMPVALVTLDAGLDLAHGLRWKWLEGPAGCDPPVWDLLQFAHGPFQHRVGRPTTLLVLLNGHPREALLFARLAAVVADDGHTLVPLRATLPGALAFFEHDAMLNALCRGALAAHPRDLTRWPGQGRDLPLYALDGDARPTHDCRDHDASATLRTPP